MIVLEDVSKIFHTDDSRIDAVKDVSARVERGEIFGVIGLSGAGKSTLVRCINLLERPTQGRVFIDGVEITGLSERELRLARRKIGMIFQSFNLFASRTAAQNIAYPLRNSRLNKKDISGKVLELLKIAGLEDKADAYPSQLSGGQKQRVAIARALANDPMVLLCDEATSSLDPQSTLSILKLLKSLNVRLGITIVVITHEMHVVKEICDRVAVMEGGRIVEEGDVFSLFARPEREITRNFIDTTTNLSKVYDLIEGNSPSIKLKPGECILRLQYLQKNASEPLMSIISRKFDVDVNIIFADLELIGESPVGGLVAIVSGMEHDINDAIQFLRGKSIGVEVILDAREFLKLSAAECDSKMAGIF
jgi:D-methionine transport system ATP-binding protein